TSTHTVGFQSISPSVRFAGKGVILPKNDRLTVPFEAVNLHSVQVTAFQVYNSNMGQFFQVNDYPGQAQMERVGRYLWRKTVKLSNDREVTGKWSRYSLDVTSLFQENPSSLFRLTLSFHRGNSTYQCPEDDSKPREEKPFKNRDQYKSQDQSYWDYSDNEYGYNSNDWNQRNDPCKDAYYKPYYNKAKVTASRNFIASNIGLMAKMGADNKLHVVTTDIRTSLPSAGANITAFNFQGRVIGKGISSSSGFTVLDVEHTPFYVEAEKSGQKGYLKVNNDSALPLSHFDVG
ncbi:MAG: hypothetical protein GY765_03370, partial [bacterium]|nr:hypothetical protein [bacterium]